MTAMWTRFWRRGAGGGPRAAWRPGTLPQPPAAQAAIPSGVRVYAVGDVHGRADLLDRVLDAIDRHRGASTPARCIEILLGDYIDRGPDSRGVIERLAARDRERQPRRHLVALAGNHEAMLREALERPERMGFWARNGGLETLMSYGVAVPTRIEPAAAGPLAEALRVRMPADHRRFLRGLAESFACGGYFFAHAGVRPGIPLDRQDPADLLWIREDFTASTADFGAVVVHGHTPVARVDMRPNRINLDTGAYITNNLSCLVLEGRSKILLPRADRGPRGSW